MNFIDIPIGIDLGTTNSCIGAFRNGVVEIIPNQINGRTTPSIVSFDDKQISIGDQTQNKLLYDPEKVIYSIKRLMGKKSNEDNFNKLIKDLAYKNKITINENNRPLISINFNGKEEKYFPEEISAMILQRLKENAEKYLKQKIKKAVITIPAYFTEAQREATKMAGEAAGFEILKIINEPTAAALAFGLGEKKDLERVDDLDKSFFYVSKKKKQFHDKFCDGLDVNEVKKILVFDLGGGTLDVTCFKITKDEFCHDLTILGHSGNIIIGGDDFDNILINHCINEFNKSNNIFINKSSKEGIKAIKRLKIQCERAKRILSYEYETTITINSLYNDIDFEALIKRSTFENICKDLFDKIIEPIQKVLRLSKMERYEIDQILLVGGSTRMPKIEEKIRDFFGEFIKIEKRYNPDELVAYGATLQAAKCMKLTALDDVLINDICSHSYGIQIKGEAYRDEFSRIIENGENIPFSSEQDYTTVNDYQKSVLIQIFEGENILCRNNKFLGSFKIDNITLAKKGVPKIKVKIELNQDGIIIVSAKEKISGSYNSLEIKGDKGIMNDEDKERMKRRLSAKEYFEKSAGNEEEKYLIETIKNLRINFKQTHDMKTFFDIKGKQEKLIEICMNETNKNNIEKFYMNCQYLFYIYNFIFLNYFKNKMSSSEEYFKKNRKIFESF